MASMFGFPNFVLSKSIMKTDVSDTGIQIIWWKPCVAICIIDSAQRNTNNHIWINFLRKKPSSSLVHELKPEQGLHQSPHSFGGGNCRQPSKPPSDIQKIPGFLSREVPFDGGAESPYG